MPKPLIETLKDGIRAEEEAISFYTALLPRIKNGNHRRSIEHILNEEKDHLKILKGILNDVVRR